VLRRLLAAPVPMPRVAVQRVVGEVYRRLAFRHPGAIDPLVTRGFTSHFADRQTARRILDTGSRLLPELRDCLRPELVECPVLLVWGRQDVMVFQTGADRVLEAVEQSELVTIEDCGHCPQLERPDRMAELLLDFPAADATAIAS
jgi:pimeloyl-ACP methyl ester carboxylesterase